MSRSRCGPVLALALLAVSPALDAAEAPGPDPASWLSRMATAARELTYDASFIYVHDGRIESMRVLHAREQGRERERLVHLSGPAREILRDGERVVGILPQGEGEVRATDLRHGAWSGLLARDVERLSRYYRFELQGPARVAGRAGQTVLVQSRDGHRYGYRLVLDRDSGLLLRSDLTDGDGEVLEQIHVISLQLPSAIPAAEFEPALAGRQVREATSAEAPAAAGLGPELPWAVAWLPEGYALSGRRRQAGPGGPAASLMFDDGLSTISVYIRESDEAAEPVEVLRRGGTTVLDQGREGFHVTVVGEIPLATAQKIADSVARRPPIGASGR